MLRLGLSGGSGSGKGYICAMLKSMGFACLDTDNLVHKLYNEDKALIEKIKNEFGDEVVSKAGTIDRSVLRNIVFSDKNKLKTLNLIVHRHVDQYCVNWLEDQENSGKSAAFIDAPQLFEAKMEHRFDYIISVIAPLEERVQRIIKRDGITKEAAEKRINNQMTNDEYKKRSHFIIHNGQTDNSLEDLIKILRSIGLSDLTIE